MRLNKFNQYGVFGLIRLFIELIFTKLFFFNARIVRLPIQIRGRKFVEISSGLTTGRYCRIEAEPKDKKSVVLKIGKNVQINDYVHITAMENVTIGDNVLMASKIYISDCSHGYYEGGENDSDPLSIPIDRMYKTKSVIIGNNVWIGESVSILPGVIIGENSIIGANSVVTKDVLANCIAVGIPAVVVKKYNFQTKKWEKI
jgi:acetyltransferase-like isoleucine patch superfamily enzyme